MKKIGIVFPHQLFTQSAWFSEVDELYLSEEFLFFRQYEFHKQKIAFHRASMKSWESGMVDSEANIHYIDAQDERSDVRILIKRLTETYPNFELHTIDPTDNWLSKHISHACETNQVQHIQHESPLFLNRKIELESFFKPSKKSFFQTSFYKQQRSKLNLLLEADGEPVGGKWTYDSDNRKKYPKGKVPPPIQFPDANETWIEAVEYTEKYFSDNPGSVSKDRLYPINQADSSAWLEQFLETRFHEFGPYEDAIVKNEIFLNHSILTPMLNTGLISPKTIIERTMEFASEHNVPINSTEGFIRQIIGWREFIRGMYEVKGVETRTTNFWGFKRKIPASFYDGTTGIMPVDDTIKKVLRTGYCHHIERLMILGNFMLLCEFDPDEVYRWFMELFIDAYDWVMVPNVYGMSQFSDGGLFATKPYISSSNYILKMSDYSKGDWQKTWDGLFWNFMDKHRDFFKTNPRSSMLINTFDKMQAEKRQNHLENAAVFLSHL